jgi:uncharacterized protein
MNRQFADTFYFLALLNSDDAAQEQADRHAQAPVAPLVTTDWVLVEVGDAMADPWNRASFLRLLDILRDDSNVEVVPADPNLFARGTDLYAARPDKGWSLTDCLSFMAMADRGITEALNADHHFEQAGFRAIFRRP